MRRVVDTNVPIVANGRPDPSRGARAPSINCRLSAIAFLERLLSVGKILLDEGGEIEKEYRRHLNPRGQPGVGDQFYRAILTSSIGSVERVLLPKDTGGRFADFPSDPDLASFDPSDRKFAALARREQVPVTNASDTDWLEHRAALERNGIAIDFVCGRNPCSWFED